jgi:signal peptidase I
MTTREAVVERLIETARGQVGTARRPVNKVKYNESYYGRPVSGEEFKWCVVFLWWCMQKCQIPMSIFPKSASVFAVRDWFKERDRFLGAGTMPKKGDLVIFEYSHIGLVAQLLPDNQILTIEGNQADAVRKVIHGRSESDIAGYCRPAYHMVEADMTKDELLDALESPRGMAILRKVITTRPGDNVDTGSLFSKVADIQKGVDTIQDKIDAT